MSGGSSPMAPKDNSLELAQLQYQREDQRRAQDEQDRLRKEGEFKTNLGNAAKGATGLGNSILSTRGLDSNKYGSIIQQAITDEQARVPIGDPNPSQYFTSDLINNALTNYQSGTQAKNNTMVNNTFAPGFDVSALPDTLMSPYINQILTTQTAQAKQALLAAQQRGQLTDTGLNAANSALSNQGKGARSTLDALGTSVLAKDRSGLGTIRSNATQGANSWQLGDPDFSINPYQTQLHNDVDKYSTNLEGDLTNALGGTPLFNVNSILLSGAQAQGPQNLTTANVPGMPVKKNNTDRGLGSQGTVF